MNESVYSSLSINTAEVIYIVQAVIALLALIFSICSFTITLNIQHKQLKIQQKTIEDSAKQNYFSNLIEIYSLGKIYTSNISGFETEIDKLLSKIKNQINSEDFDEFYHSEPFDKLREAISYFNFIQNLIKEGCLSIDECCSIVTFPKSLYKKLEPLIEYEENNRLHDFDGFNKFCKSYIEYMNSQIKKRRY